MHLQGVGWELPAVLPRHGSPPDLPSEPPPDPEAAAQMRGTYLPPSLPPGRQAAAKGKRGQDGRLSFPAPPVLVPASYPVVVQ